MQSLKLGPGELRTKVELAQTLSRVEGMVMTTCLSSPANGWRGLEF